MKISKKRPNCWQRWVVFFEKKRARWSTVFISWLDSAL